MAPSVSSPKPCCRPAASGCAGAGLPPVPRGGWRRRGLRVMGLNDGAVTSPVGIADEYELLRARAGGGAGGSAGRRRTRASDRCRVRRGGAHRGGLLGARHRQWHGQEWDHRPQDRRDAHLDRDPGLLPQSGGRHARRPGHREPGRRGDPDLEERRVRGAGRTGGIFQPLRCIHDRDDRPARSSLGRVASVVLDCSVEEEACPMDLAPTTSTTVTLVHGGRARRGVAAPQGLRVRGLRPAAPGRVAGAQALAAWAPSWSAPEDELPSIGPDEPMRRCVVLLAEKRGTVPVVDGPDG
jgi:hypothetical protein